METTLAGIKGTHHSQFVPRDIVNSDEYAVFWSDLAQGKSMEGMFKRITSTGKIVWLNAIYNPIRNANGEVVKVIKFAKDMTDHQENAAETQGILEGVDAKMATIQFTPDGKIVTANDNFLATMKYNLDEIVGQHHKMLVPDDIHGTAEYVRFWDELASGRSVTGKFIRTTSDGQAVTLNAIYNPILSSTGKVKKVIKFATLES